ncbi:VIT1/CCC1 transporter family protein [Rhizobium cauense]|uniref:VIT1/CCC1 transporter family protein n=1 Tax=Rhizobium cauense TaxID=1166683 RepID=UPI001C6E4FBA|nr:VIT1/CCC1 transporter family protein [Rhizobium cauense]MBW9117134.1 VIT1/CCC1 transporter family protein [Rhizobium cauense]
MDFNMPRISDAIDPGDALGEVLFGLIMALTFTVGSRLLFSREGLDVPELVIATIGCNVAWGIIDAVLFVLGTVFYKSRRVRVFRQIKAAGSEQEAISALRKEFPLDSEPYVAASDDEEALYRAMLDLARRGSPAKLRLSMDDLVAAIVVFLLVSATSLPAVIPFFLIGNADLALRTSNFLLIALLFLTGCGWARFSDAKPLLAGMTMTCLGLLLVGIAIALGG